MVTQKRAQGAGQPAVVMELSGTQKESVSEISHLLAISTAAPVFCHPLLPLIYEVKAIY